MTTDAERLKAWAQAFGTFEAYLKDRQAMGDVCQPETLLSIVQNEMGGMAREAEAIYRATQHRIRELETINDTLRKVLKAVHRDGEAVNRCGYEISSDMMQQVFATIREDEPDYY